MKKELQLIMLPKTGEIDRKTQVLWTNKSKQILHTHSMSQELTPQSLYLLSDEEIKEGDWYLDTNNNVVQANKESIKFNNPQIGWNKIVATTDTSLTTKEWMLKYGKLPLASIPKSLIEAFVESQGKLTKVLVEYEQKGCDSCENLELTQNQGCCGKENIQLKLNPNNTIIWSLVEEKSYTHDELIAYLKMALNHPMRTVEEVMERIKEIIG